MSGESCYWNKPIYSDHWEVVVLVSKTQGDYVSVKRCGLRRMFPGRVGDAYQQDRNVNGVVNRCVFGRCGRSTAGGGKARSLFAGWWRGISNLWDWVVWVWA